MDDRFEQQHFRANQQQVNDYSACRLGELVELALEHELVESCHVSRDAVVVSFGGRSLTFPPAEARGFLSSILHGWFRTQAPVQTIQPVADVRKRNMFSLASDPSSGLPGKAVSTNGSIARSNGSATGDIESEETYIDAVLACAEKLNVIEGYRKDESTQRVVLRTKATTTDMSYVETLKYLTESILEELGHRVQATT